MITHDERIDLANKLFDECLHIMNTKGLSYASEADATKNFKDVAEAAGFTKYQAWLAYFIKHVQSVSNAIKRDPEKPTVADGEPLRERVKDIINYGALLLLMQEEDEMRGWKEKV